MFKEFSERAFHDPILRFRLFRQFWKEKGDPILHIEVSLGTVPTTSLAVIDPVIVLFVSCISAPEMGRYRPCRPLFRKHVGKDSKRIVRQCRGESLAFSFLSSVV